MCIRNLAREDVLRLSICVLNHFFPLFKLIKVWLHVLRNKILLGSLTFGSFNPIRSIENQTVKNEFFVHLHLLLFIFFYLYLSCSSSSNFFSVHLLFIFFPLLHLSFSPTLESKDLKDPNERDPKRILVHILSKS